LWRSA